MDRLDGKTLSRYRIEAQIGRGGMASVYRATDPAFRRTVAIKVLAPHLARDPQFVERFLREAHSSAHLQHPHIIPVYDVGEQDGLAFLVMQYVDGGTLRDRLNGQEGKRLPTAEALAILRPVALALDYAHRQGVIHRDIKPNNILLSSQGYPLLADFGIAKVLEAEHLSSITATGMLVGTPEYMSPEQAQGMPVDGRSDLYALATVLYEALTGRTPFRAEGPTDTPLAILVRHVTTTPPMPRLTNPAISPEVEQALMRGLAKHRDERFATGVALFDALELAAGTTAAAGVPVGAAPDPGEEATTTITPGERGAEGAPVARPVTPPPAASHLASAAVASHDTPPSPPPAAPASMHGKSRRRYIGLGTLAILLLALSIGGAISLARGRGATPPVEGAIGTPVGTAIEASILAPSSATSTTAPPPSTPARGTANEAGLIAPPSATSSATPTTAPPTSTPARGTASVPVATTGTARSGPPASPAGAPAASAGRREVILFSSHRGDIHDSQIYVMAPDGADQRQLTFSRGHSWGPRLSPDGRQFVFSSVAPGEHNDHSATGGGAAGQGNHDIYLAGSDGANITKLTRETSWDNAWSWSPDGRWITFASDRDGNWELYRMGTKGDAVTRLTNDSAQDGWPSYTPDGKQIVFASNRSGMLSQIYIMNADGSNVRRLHFSETFDTFPFVSPDGTKIVYSAQDPRSREGEIYVMNIDGSESKRLTSTVALNTEPSWSPDGRKIAFVSDRDGNSNIYVMNADGTNQVRLTTNRGEDVTPAWGYLQDGPSEVPVGSAVTLPLAALNNSGQSGTVVLTDRGNRTTGVVVTVQGGPAGVEQPLHFHEGSCANLDPTPLHPLRNLLDGRSESVIQVPLSELLGKPHALVAHKSAQEAAIYVTCGDLGKPASGMSATRIHVVAGERVRIFWHARNTSARPEAWMRSPVTTALPNAQVAERLFLSPGTMV
ncbi:MAG: tolB protein precursor, periplasmic protein involved in the tonb-independent uptake of group A colicins [uncultured Thermomicrobiales bacterium]|uniref:non-specific serine/threonine protein kinase n=1 Tax=uncultured Thermomicrobiales bacterium TaxID=1645740 RepID=A0A6J4UHS8_9BACT|nr:MAG: tolB protein precursor, periplasmic protein involved in the tonb-independent uptake of group A colicins [uncultured Thermomicrobiales bacterium]